MTIGKWGRAGRGTAVALALVLGLSGCLPADLTGKKPDGSIVSVSFYPGGNALDDLVIVDERNFFGQGQYQIDDPLADVGFRLNGGPRVQAECSRIGTDILGDPECKEYTVYRSDFDPIPAGTVFDRPQIF